MDLNLKRTTKTGPSLQKQTTWYNLVLCVPGWFNGEVIPILGFGSMCMSLLHLSSSHEFFPNLPLTENYGTGLRSEVGKDGTFEDEVIAREEAVKDAGERSEHESWAQNQCRWVIVI